MEFQCIADIYSASDQVRFDLKELLSQITDAEANHLPAGERWTIAQTVEHIATVNDGVFRICRKLLGRAQEAGAPASKSLNVSDDFLDRSIKVHSIKLEAPERVHPTGGVSIHDSSNGRAKTAFRKF
jgi:DinB family protein